LIDRETFFELYVTTDLTIIFPNTHVTHGTHDMNCRWNTASGICVRLCGGVGCVVVGGGRAGKRQKERRGGEEGYMRGRRHFRRVTYQPISRLIMKRAKMEYTYRPPHFV
jgi:hypothetical protein